MASTQSCDECGSKGTFLSYVQGMFPCCRGGLGHRHDEERNHSVTRPRRVLLVSATIGEGHNATARALEEAARRLWPDCEVRWLDALRVMGRGVGPVFQWIYVVNVERTPWLYNFFYAALWRYRWFASGSRRFVGAWCGRRLRSLVRECEPDLVISTYPLGTAGLDWMRRRGELEVPLAAVVSDFSPHPFWVYSEVDRHFVMSAESLGALYRAQPDAAGIVSVPPVVAEFAPGEKQPARRHFGLPEDDFLVLISCGSLGFGSIERAARAALGAPGVGCVVVVCGHNEQVRNHLAESLGDDERLKPLGWVREMATLTTAADIVVTNAGGATALEALACGRAVAMFEPIAGHGRGNAELMTRAGLSDLCPTVDDLTRTLQELSEQPERLREREQRALDHIGADDFVNQVAELASIPRHAGTHPLRGQDAFFVHAASSAVPQQNGAVLQLEEVPPGTTEQDWYTHLVDLVSQRAPDLPMLHRRLVHRGVRRPTWFPVQRVEPDQHVGCRTLDGVREQEWLKQCREFFEAPVRTDNVPPWELLLLRDPQAGRTVLLAKMHHALGDGAAVTGAMAHLLRDSSGNDPVRFPKPHKVVRPSLKVLAERAVSVVRGLASLAIAGPAPASGWEGPSTPGRRYGWQQLSAAELRAGAREHGVGSSVLLVAVIAEALHRVLAEQKTSGSGAREHSFRAMVPKTTRDARDSTPTRLQGNHTVSVAVDLPVGPMSPQRRVQEVAALLDGAERRGQLAASRVVLAVLGKFPNPVRAWVVRRIYQRRFFNAVVSAMPGPRRPPRINGALIAGVLPVLSLADGVGIAVGAISWGERASIVITGDARLGALPEELAEKTGAAFDALHPVSERGEPA